MSAKLGDSLVPKTQNEFNIAISASAISAVLLVSGFCWIVYYVCRPNKRHAPRGGNNVRKVRAHSITSGASVPGDSHGHYYAPRNPNVYADRDLHSYGEPTNGLRSLTLFPSVFDLGSKTLPIITTDDTYASNQHGEPPPYPGQLNEVISHSHSASRAPLPPPYSA